MKKDTFKFVHTGAPATDPKWRATVKCGGRGYDRYSMRARTEQEAKDLICKYTGAPASAVKIYPE
jgi:hypothetical protein